MWTKEISGNTTTYQQDELNAVLTKIEIVRNGNGTAKVSIYSANAAILNQIKDNSTRFSTRPEAQVLPVIQGAGNEARVSLEHKSHITIMLISHAYHHIDQTIPCDEINAQLYCDNSAAAPTIVQQTRPLNFSLTLFS
jgi:hypothetical protein